MNRDTIYLVTVENNMERQNKKNRRVEREDLCLVGDKRLWLF